MKIKLYINHLLLFCLSFFILLCFVSCEKETEISLNSSEPQIVIEGLVQLDSLATVKITRTQDYNQQGGFPPVNNAVVTISDNLGNIEVLKQNKAGLYCAKTIKGVEGRTYKLLVKVDDKDYTSSSTLPKFVKIDSLYMYNIPAIRAVYPMIQFRDIPGERNYYKAVLFINNKRMRLVFDVTDDKDRDGTVISFLLTYNKGYNNDLNIQQGDLIAVYLQCLDKGSYTYFETLSRIEGTLNNPTSNIKGGALGYFSACTSDVNFSVANW